MDAFSPVVNGQEPLHGTVVLPTTGTDMLITAWHLGLFHPISCIHFLVRMIKVAVEGHTLIDMRTPLIDNYADTLS